jgi:hypothetical protein
MLRAISGVHWCTAAENVCRRQTLATVGSPVDDRDQTTTERGWGRGLTCKYVFMDPCQLNVGFTRVGDEQTVDYAFGNDLRKGMTEIELGLH